MTKLYVLFVYMMSAFLVKGKNPETELRLRKNLFSKHNSAIRPVSNISQPVEINADLELYALNSFDTINGILNTQCSLELSWYDEFLSWDPREYNNISMLYVSSRKIWRPIVIVCNAETVQIIDNEARNLVLHNDGRVVLWYQEIMRTFCTIDAHNYPFDKQHCHILICVAIHKTKHAIIKRLHYHKARFFKNYQWDVDMEGIRESEDNSGRSLTRAKLLLRRKIKISTIALMVPPAIFTVVSIFVFLLPAESGEKVSLATTLFLSIIVYLVELDKLTPKNSESMPLVTIYLLTLTTLSGINTIGAIIECRMYIIQERRSDIKKYSINCDESKTEDMPQNRVNKINDTDKDRIRNTEKEIGDDVRKIISPSTLRKENKRKNDVNFIRHKARYQRLSNIFVFISVMYVISSIIAIYLTSAQLNEE